MTHTYAVLEVSDAAYQEIRRKLEAAGYQQAFHGKSDEEVIDMHGIALKSGGEPSAKTRLRVTQKPSGET